MLLGDRLGIPVDIAIKLYKALVRPHIDYAIAAWASIRDSDLLKLEQAQSQSLRRLTGVKRHSATAALEVLSGIMPVRFRIMDLCSREYMKLMVKCDGHPVKELLQHSVMKSSVFTPLEYIKYISRDLQRVVGELEFRKEGSVSAEHILDKRLIEKFSLFTTPIGCLLYTSPSPRDS